MNKNIQKSIKKINNNDIEFYQDKTRIGLHFKKPINPQVLIDAIKKIDG